MEFNFLHFIFDIASLYVCPQSSPHYPSDSCVALPRLPPTHMRSPMSNIHSVLLPGQYTQYPVQNPVNELSIKEKQLNGSQ